MHVIKMHKHSCKDNYYYVFFLLLLLFYLDSDLPKEFHFVDSWPNGLILLENFITEDEEKELLGAINLEESEGNNISCNTTVYVLML